MFVHLRRDAGQFARRKPVVPFELDGIQPELRTLGLPLNVDVWRFVLVAREKEESVRPCPKNSGASRPNDCAIVSGDLDSR
jgi:hypothetical protein